MCCYLGDEQRKAAISVSTKAVRLCGQEVTRASLVPGQLSGEQQDGHNEL